MSTSSSRMMSLDVSDSVCRMRGMELGSRSYRAMSCRAVFSVSSTMNRRLNTLCTKTSRERRDRNANITGSCVLLFGPTSMIPCEPVMTTSSSLRSCASYVSPSTCLISFSNASLSK